MSGDSSFDDRFDELRAQYVGRVRERVERIERFVDRLRDGFERETFDELFQLVHRLSGSGETMGFPELSDLSIALEERLESAEPSEREEWLDQVEAYCRRVRELVGAA